jgi:hypothetical protein
VRARVRVGGGLAVWEWWRRRGRVGGVVEPKIGWCGWWQRCEVGPFFSRGGGAAVGGLGRATFGRLPPCWVQVFMQVLVGSVMVLASLLGRPMSSSAADRRGARLQARTRAPLVVSPRRASKTARPHLPTSSPSSRSHYGGVQEEERRARAPSWASSRDSRGRTRPGQTARPKRSSRPCSESGPTATPTPPYTTAPERSPAGSAGITGEDRTAPSEASHRSAASRTSVVNTPRGATGEPDSSVRA